MKDYYETFVKLALQLCLKEDYAHKARVRANNVAAKKLIRLQKEMQKLDCTEILQRLLAHEDARVKINAAAFCLQTKVIVDTAIAVLHQISQDHSVDPTLCFDAQMVLQVYG